MAEENEPEVFDAEYVQKLRDEAAKYRTKAKDLESSLKGKQDLESQLTNLRVENELIRRGAKADPSWVPLEGFEDPTEAVDAFLERFPQLRGSEEPVPRPHEDVPPSLPPEPSKANVPGPSPVGAFGGRNLEEIKKDPKARDKLTRAYRQHLGVDN